MQLYGEQIIPHGYTLKRVVDRSQVVQVSRGDVDSGLFPEFANRRGCGRFSATDAAPRQVQSRPVGVDYQQERMAGPDHDLGPDQLAAHHAVPEQFELPCGSE